MNIIDYVLFGILALILIVDLCKGFIKSGLNNLFVILTIVAIIFLCPLICESLIKIEAIASLSTTFQGWLSFLGDGVGEIVLKVVLFIAVALAIIIVCKIISSIIKHLLKKVQLKGVFKIIDKLFGGIFGVALYGAIGLVLLGIIGTLNIEVINTYMSGSFISNNNFLATYCEQYINLGDLISQITGSAAGNNITEALCNINQNFLIK